MQIIVYQLIGAAALVWLCSCVWAKLHHQAQFLTGLMKHISAVQQLFLPMCFHAFTLEFCSFGTPSRTAVSSFWTNNPDNQVLSRPPPTWRVLQTVKVMTKKEKQKCTFLCRGSTVFLVCIALPSACWIIAGGGRCDWQVTLPGNWFCF